MIRDTCIPVRSLLARHDGGDSPAEIARDDPDVPEEALAAAAVAYARTHPERGRPRRRLR